MGTQDHPLLASEEAGQFENSTFRNQAGGSASLHHALSNAVKSVARGARKSRVRLAACGVFPKANRRFEALRIIASASSPPRRMRLRTRASDIEKVN